MIIFNAITHMIWPRMISQKSRLYQSLHLLGDPGNIFMNLIGSIERFIISSTVNTEISALTDSLLSEFSINSLIFSTEKQARFLHNNSPDTTLYIFPEKTSLFII